MEEAVDKDKEKKKRKGIIKRLTIFASMIPVLFILTSTNLNKKSKDHFRINTKVSENKIVYNSGTIYIGDKKYLDSIESLGENDILVLDERKAKDPNIKIYDSYKIMNADIREEIIEALLLYEEVYPTDWARTKNSLMREWTAHNVTYRVGYEPNRTTDVDLNNYDEMTYRIRK